MTEVKKKTGNADWDNAGKMGKHNMRKWNKRKEPQAIDSRP